MKLWLLEANWDALKDGKTVWSYDMNVGLVIRAETEGEARRIAAVEPGTEPEGTWLSSEYGTCEEL